MEGRSPRARARAADRLNVTPAGPPEKRDSVTPLDAGPPPPPPPPTAAPATAAGSKSRLERLLAGPCAAAALPAAESVSAMLSRAAEALPEATLAASTDGRRWTAKGTGSLRGGGANAVSAETEERNAQTCLDTARRVDAADREVTI